MRIVDQTRKRGLEARFLKTGDVVRLLHNTSDRGKYHLVSDQNHVVNLISGIRWEPRPIQLFEPINAELILTNR